MKYFLIAGEASGDLHASKLMKEIKKIDPNAIFMYFGGELMQNEGGILLKHYREMAFMGILPVLLNLRTIKHNFRLCESELIKFQPDVVILIDYPGFNLRMAKFAKQNLFRVVYYISPKIWAWKTRRIKDIKAYVDQVFTIFPFETNFYKKHNYEVTYVGNPIVDIISEELEKETDFDVFCSNNQLENKPIVALLAGSRVHEIQLILPAMEQITSSFPDYQFVIAGAPGFSPEYYQSVLKSNLKVIFNQTYLLLRNSRAAIVASGTATLETALLSVPQVVIYKVQLGWLLELFKKYILKTKYFSLVNLVAEKEVVKEYFQTEVTNENLVSELNKLLYNNEYRENMLSNYDQLSKVLKTDGAAEIAARSITEKINKSQQND